MGFCHDFFYGSSGGRLDAQEQAALRNRINTLWGRRDPASQKELDALLSTALRKGYRYRPYNWLYGGPYLEDDED